MCGYTDEVLLTFVRSVELLWVDDLPSDDALFDLWDMGPVASYQDWMD